MSTSNRRICGRTCGCDDLCPAGERMAESIKAGDYQHPLSDAEMDGRANDDFYNREPW